MGRKHRPQMVGVIVVSDFGVLHVVSAVVVNDMAGILTVSTEMFGFTSIESSGESTKWIRNITIVNRNLDFASKIVIDVVCVAHDIVFSR